MIASVTSAADAAAAKWLAANRAAIVAIHDAKTRAAAQKALAATLARMRASTPAPRPATDLRAAAARELAAGGYDLGVRALRPAEKSLWDRFWDWFGQQWDRFWRATGGRVNLGPSGWNVIGWAFLVIVGGALVFVIVRLIASAQFDRSGRRGRSSPLEAGRSARALYMQACELARLGDYAQAARLLFAAAGPALHLRGLMRDAARARAGDRRRARRARDGAMVPPFDQIAGPFITAAYAERAVAPAEWERALAGYRELVKTEPT